MIIGLILAAAIGWVFVVYAAYEIGAQKGRRYDAVALALILGPLGLAIFLVNVMTERVRTGGADRRNVTDIRKAA